MTTMAQPAERTSSPPSRPRSTGEEVPGNPSSAPSRDGEGGPNLDDSSAARATKNRIVVEFSADASERLRDIKEILNAPSNAEVVRKALVILDWLLSLERGNRRVQVVDEDGKVTEMKFVW